MLILPMSRWTTPAVTLPNLRNVPCEMLIFETCVQPYLKPLAWPPHQNLGMSRLRSSLSGRIFECFRDFTTLILARFSTSVQNQCYLQGFHDMGPFLRRFFEGRCRSTCSQRVVLGLGRPVVRVHHASSPFCAALKDERKDTSAPQPSEVVPKWPLKGQTCICLTRFAHVSGILLA